MKTFTISQARPWMTGQPGQCALYFDHQDQVMEDLLARKEGRVDEELRAAAVASLDSGKPDSLMVGR